MSQGNPLEFQRQWNEMAQRVRQMDAEHKRLFDEVKYLRDQRLVDTGVIEKIMKATSMSRTGEGSPRGRNWPMAKGPGHGPYVDIAQFPGRHIPFDFLVDIAIRDGATDTATGTLMVTMEGPMVCTHRVACFRSQHTFRVQGADSTAAFQSRSFGRFRPIDSSGDWTDALRAFEQPNGYQPAYIGAVFDGTNFVPIGNPMGVHGPSGTGGAAGQTAATSLPNMIPNFPGNGRPLNMSPLSMSAFRSMEMDSTILVEVQGANFQRSNQNVPSTLWRSGNNEPFPLSTLDVFEPGESIVLAVSPTHVNNPAAGNIAGIMLASNDFTYTVATGASVNNPSPSPTPITDVGLPTGGFPFLAGQYDGHEGIDSESVFGDSAETSDRVTRVANGILTIGFIGYRIVQPPQMLT